MDNQSFTVRVPKSWVRLGLVALVTALIVAPLTAVATHSFDDVPNDNSFHDDIEWLKQSGVTLGCHPPDNTEFCPDDPVSREQMSAFMHRLAQNTAPRASFNSEIDVPNGAPYSLSTEITAPAPGIILTNAGIDAWNGPDEFYRCRVLLNDALIPGSQMDSELDGQGSSNSEENCSNGGGVAVEAGTDTITLDVSSVDTGTDFAGAFVWALWVPYDGMGETPTSFTQLGNLGSVTEEKPSE